VDHTAAIPADALLVWLLIHGAWGLPRLELFGAGLATTMISVGMFLAGLWFAANRRPFKKYYVLGGIWRIDWALMRQLIVIGAPISIAFLLEYGLFGAAGLLMGLIGTTALAAHHRTGLGAIGVWVGLSCGTAVYAMLLILRFRLLTHRLRVAMPIGAH
jgi:Na+-driven multidrug efflux pump